MLILKAVILITSLFQTIIGQEKRCTGSNGSEMPDDCVIIEKSKLIFTEDDVAIFRKMSQVRRIEHGVEVIGTTLEDFDYLNDVEEIRNPDGPAIVFRNNKDLKRISMEKLKIMKGKEEDVLFDQDNFPAAAYDTNEAFDDILRLEAAARAARGSEQCSENFIKIISAEPTGYGWLFYTLIALCIIAIGLVVFNAFRFVKAKRKVGKKLSGSKKGSAERVSKTKNEKPSSAEKVSGKTNSKIRGIRNQRKK